MKRIINIVRTFVAFAAVASCAWSPAVAQTAAPAAPAAEAANALPRGALVQLGSARFRGGGRISSVVFSPDGKYLVGGCSDGVVWVWTVASGQVAKRLAVGSAGMGRVSFSGDPLQLHCLSELGGSQVERHAWSYPDWKAAPRQLVTTHNPQEAMALERPSHRLLTLDKARGFIVRDLAANSELLVVRPDEGRAVASLAPNGALLAVSSSGGRGQATRLDLWSVTDQRKLHEWKTEGLVAENWAATPDGKFLIAGSDGHDFICWDLASGAEMSRLQNKNGLNFVPLASADGKLLVVPCVGGLNIFEIPGGKLHCHVAADADLRFATFSPDGKLLAVCGLNSLAFVFDVDTGREFLAHEGHLAGVVDLKFSRDGRRLLSLDGRLNLIPWDLAAKKQQTAAQLPDYFSRIVASAAGDSVVVGRRDALPRTWKIGSDAAPLADYVRQARPFVAAVSRSGRLLVAEGDGALELFHVVGEKKFTGYPNATFRGHLGGVAAVAISADARVAASLGDDRTLQIWADGAADPTRIIPLAGPPQPCIALAEDGGRVAAFVEGALTVWKSSGGEPLLTLKLADEQPGVVRFFPDGESLLVGTKQGRLHVGGIREGKWLRAGDAQHGGVNAIEFAADGSVVYTAGQDGSLCAWNPATLQKTATIDTAAAPVLCLALFGDDKHLAAGDESGKLVLCDIAAQRRERDFQKPSAVRCVAVSADGKEIATLEDPDRRTFVDLTTARPASAAAVSFRYSNEDGRVAISDDGQWLARFAPAGVRVWQTGHDEPVRRWPTTALDSSTITFSHSGKLLAAGGGGGFCLWDLAANRPLVEVPESSSGKVSRLEFSPDDRFLVPFANYQDGLKIWNVATGRVVSEIRFPRPFVFRQIYFSADSRVLMVVNSPPVSPRQTGRSTIEAWEIASGGYLGELPLPDEIASSVAISADERQLALGFDSGLIRLYDFAEIAKPLDAINPAVETAALPELCDKLGSTDQQIAHSAVLRMSREPDAAIALLAAKFKAPPQAASEPPDPAALVNQLGSDDPAVSRSASTGLRKLGPAAHSAMSAALAKNPSPAVKSRLELLLAARPDR